MAEANTWNSVVEQEFDHGWIIMDEKYAEILL